MHPRLFLLALVLAVLGRDSKLVGAAPSPRPNFLFLYADDHRWDALGCVQQEQGERGRFPWFQTPHMDRLAREGVRFRNAFVTLSLCAPSRAAFLTGRYNHFNGVASNFRPFPVGNVTHATLLRAAGYTTGYAGKWHMDSQRDRPGFDYSASYIGHSNYTRPTFLVNGEEVPREGWIDDLATDYAIDFLKANAQGSQPWSLVVGFKSPHGPFTPPDRAANRFEGMRARIVPNFNSPAPYSRRSQERTRQVASDTALVPVNLNYLRCVSAIDDCVGRLLDALEELDLAENTCVIYASDNGFYLGEHGLGDKRSAYEESLRIPFLVRFPRLGDVARGRTCDDMVLNIDLAPTLLDVAGLESPPEIQGRSWRALLEGKHPEWRQSMFYEYFAEKQNNSDVPDITAVRTATAKLIRYPGHDDWTELFDLRTDPYETRNLIRDADSKPLLDQMQAEYDRLVKETGYRVPEYVDRPDWWERGVP